MAIDPLGAGPQHQQAGQNGNGGGFAKVLDQANPNRAGNPGGGGKGAAQGQTDGAPNNGNGAAARNGNGGAQRQQGAGQNNRSEGPQGNAFGRQDNQVPRGLAGRTRGNEGADNGRGNGFGNGRFDGFGRGDGHTDAFNYFGLGRGDARADFNNGRFDNGFGGLFRGRDDGFGGLWTGSFGPRGYAWGNGEGRGGRIGWPDGWGANLQFQGERGPQVSVRVVLDYASTAAMGYFAQNAAANTGQQGPLGNPPAGSMAQAAAGAAQAGLASAAAQAAQNAAGLNAMGAANAALANGAGGLAQINLGAQPWQTAGFDFGLSMARLTHEEIGFVSGWRMAGRSAEDIYQGLLSIRYLRATEGYDLAGMAFARRALPVHTANWLAAQPGTLSLFPAQIASKLNDRNFSNFAEFRVAFWKSVADTPELAREFSPANLARMRNGMAPIAPSAQHWGDLNNYMLMHHVPFAQGGSIFDMSNILIVSPLMQQLMLDPRFFTAISIMYSDEMRARYGSKRRRLGRRRRWGREEFNFGGWAQKKWRKFFQKRQQSKPGRRRWWGSGAPAAVLSGELLIPKGSRARPQPWRPRAGAAIVLTQRPLPAAHIEGAASRPESTQIGNAP